MKRYNPQLLEKLFAYCADNNAVEVITPDFYQTFLNMDDNTIRIISKVLIRSLAKFINADIEDGKLKTNKDLARYITDFWEMMIQGFLVVNESDMKIAFRKPRGVGEHLKVSHLNRTSKCTTPV